MLNRNTLQASFSSNKVAIMFILLMILLIVLAWWVSGRLIEHIDHNMPGL